MKESTNPVRMHIQKMKNQPTTNQVQGVDLLGQNKGGSYVVVVNSSISSRSSYYELPAGLLAEATHESNKFGAEAPIQKGNHIMTENKVSGSTNSTPTSAFEFTQVGLKLNRPPTIEDVTETLRGVRDGREQDEWVIGDAVLYGIEAFGEKNLKPMAKPLGECSVKNEQIVAAAVVTGSEEVQNAVEASPTVPVSSGTGAGGVSAVQPANTGSSPEPWIELLPTGATFHGDVSRTKVSELLKAENQANKSSAWRIGDAARYIKKQFGFQALLELVQELKLDYGSVKTGLWLAGKLPASPRNDALSVEHHRAVAGLETEAEMERYLKQAVTENLSARDLTEKIGKKGGKSTVDFDCVWRKTKGLSEVVKQGSLKLDEKERELLRAQLQELLEFVVKPENCTGKRSKSGKRGQTTAKVAGTEVVATAGAAVMPSIR